MPQVAKKLRIAVLMGGPSAEYEISLKSGRMVLRALDKKKYIATPIVISKKGKWPVNFADFKKKFDLAFVAMHGEYGEDGTVQKILERHKIIYTGSDSQASKLGMDKIKSAAAFKKAGLAVPSSGKRFPLVVKPADRGSSVGVSIINSQQELTEALKLARRYSKKILVQEFVSGRELTCGVLEIDGHPRALPPTEIIPKSTRFFDYKAKYVRGASEEITPPKVPEKVIKKIQAQALLAHKVIGASGFSRTDMIVGDSRIYVLEINTIPGMTETSLLPQQAKAAGISFPKLLDIIIKTAWNPVRSGANIQVTSR